MKYCYNRGFPEVKVDVRRLAYPNLVVLKNGQPMQIAVIPVSYPFQGIISESQKSSIQLFMDEELENCVIFVKFKNISNHNRPWDMLKSATLQASISEETLSSEMLLCDD